jgi:hypothetical protein
MSFIGPNGEDINGSMKYKKPTVTFQFAGYLHHDMHRTRLTFALNLTVTSASKKNLPTLLACQAFLEHVNLCPLIVALFEFVDSDHRSVAAQRQLFFHLIVDTRTEAKYSDQPLSKQAFSELPSG